MATLLDAPKPTTAKHDEFVEKQIAEARRRIRLVDGYGVALVLFCAFLAFTLTALIIDRYVQTRPGTGWAALAGFLLLGTGFVWFSLFRGGRRSINPYFAARQVEATIPDAKNSLINWIDLKEDQKLPDSLRAAMGARAAKDLKHADMTRVPEGKSFTWGLIAAGVLGIGCLVVAFLPPTRTEIRLVLPKDGDATVFSGEDVRFEAKLLGRIPKAKDPDRARLRVWYNPEDDTTYDDFPLEVSPDDRRLWGTVIKANQVRKGFDYQFLAGDGFSPRHHVTCKIIPILTGFEIGYKLPKYLTKPDEITNDPNLFNYFGSEVTITAQTNRQAAKGYLEIAGQARTYDAEIPADRPDSLRFKIPLEKEGQYRIFFTTTEGDRNSDPQKYRIGLVDPKPLFVSFDHKFQYPDYLRWKPQTILGGKSADIEAIRGTVTTLVARANRPVASALAMVDGVEKPINGDLLPDDPMAVSFTFPALTEDKTFRLVLTPKTGEGESEPKTYSIRVLRDEAPEVRITLPKEATIELPANGTLEVEGLATDDHGISRMNLKLAVSSPISEALKDKPYRDGKEFKREKDNSFPTRLEYKDGIELGKLQFESDERKNTKIVEGMIIEYWLEAIDNCNEPGPNRAFSKRQQVKVVAPVKEADKAKAQEQRKAQFDAAKKKHDEDQDKKNAEEERAPAQPDPKPNGQPQEGEPKKGEGQPGGDAAKGAAQPKQGEGQGKQGEGKPGANGADGSRKPQENPDAKPGDGNPGDARRSGGMDPKEKETQEKADRVRKELEKQDKIASKEPGERNKPEPLPMPKGAGEPETDPASKPDSKQGPPKSGSPGTPGKQDGKSKPQQGPPPEPGELSREIADKDYKMDAGQKEDMERLLRNPEKRKEMQDKIDEMKKDIKDPAKKDQFEKDTNQAKENAKKQDDIDELAKKSKDKDPKKAEQAKRDLDEKMKDPANREQGEKAGEQMEKGKGSDPQAGDKRQAIEDSMDKGREQNLKDAAKQMQSGDAGEKAEGQKKMDDLMKDPKARNQAEKMKDELAKGAGDDKQKQEDFKKELDKSADKGRQENADKIAKDAKSESPGDQAKAEKELEKLKQNDPKGAEQAQRQMQKDGKDETAKKDGTGGNEAMPKKDGQPGGKETAKKDGDGGNEGMEKKGDPSGKQGQPKGGTGEGDPMGGGQGGKKEIAKGGKQGGKGGGDTDPGELDRELQSKDQDFSGKAKQNDLENLLRDSELRKKAEQSLEEAKKNQPDPAKREEMQKNFDEAKRNADLRNKMQEDVDELVKKKKPEEKKDVANKNDGQKGGDPKGESGKDSKSGPGKGGDPASAKKDAGGATDAAQQQAEKNLQEQLKDPNARAQAEKMVDEMRKKDPAAAEEMKKKIDQVADKAREEQLKDAAQKAGQAGAGQPKDKAAKDLAEAMKDPKTRQMAKDMMDKLMDQAKDPEKRKQLEEMMKQAADQARKDNLKDLAKDAKSKDQRDVEKAAKDLKELMEKDPEAKKMMEDLAKKAQDPEVMKGLQELQKKAEELAKQMPKKDGPEEVPMPKSKDDLAAKGKDGERGEAPKDGKEKDPEAKGEGKKKSDMAGGGQKTGNLKGENPQSVSKDGLGRTEGVEADLANRLKAGELQLKGFRENVGNKELLKKLDYTEAEYAEFLKSYEEMIAKLRKQLAEKKETLPTLRTGSSGLNSGAETIKIEGGKDSKIERGSKAVPPPDFRDAYKRYTEQQSGVGEPKPGEKQPK